LVGTRTKSIFKIPYPFCNQFSTYPAGIFATSWQFDCSLAKSLVQTHPGPWRPLHESTPTHCTRLSPGVITFRQGQAPKIYKNPKSQLKCIEPSRNCRWVWVEPT